MKIFNLSLILMFAQVLSGHNYSIVATDGEYAIYLISPS